MKPIIAIVPRAGKNIKGEKHCYALPRFVTAISACGGIPIALNNLEGTFELSDLDEILDRVDGVVFSGGPDIHPKHYGEEVLDCCGEIAYERDALELPLIRKALEKNKPIMCVCRGFQVLNVALGGTLYQDINVQMQRSTQIEHRRDAEGEESRGMHTVNVIRDTPLDTFAGGQTKIGVNTLHHQGVKKLAESLCSMATADDGLIESAYYPEKDFVMAFQWHPEYLGLEDSTSKKIFMAFVEASKREMERRK